MDNLNGLKEVPSFKKRAYSWSSHPMLKKAVVNGLWEVLSHIFIVMTALHVAEISLGQPVGQYFLLLLLAIVMDAVAYKRYNRYLVRYVEGYVSKIRSGVIEKVRNTSLKAFEEIGSEKIYTVLTYDMGEISSLSRTIANTIRLAVRAFLLFLWLITLSWVTCVIAMIFFGIMGIFYVYVQLRVSAATEQVREREKRLFDAVSDLLNGFKELQLHHRKSEDFFNNGLRPHAAELTRLKTQSHLYFVYSFILCYVLWIGILSAMVLIIPEMTPSFSKTLITSVGIIIMMPRFLLTNEVPRIIMAHLSMRRLLEFENVLQRLSSEPAGEAEEVGFNEIRYENVMFRYGEADRPFSVGPISIRIQAGEIVFVTGGNGSGKTTLLKLMTGLYPVGGGHVYLNGGEIRMEEYRWLFSPIFTDFHLFDRLYGIESVDETQVDELLDMFQLDKKVRFEDEVFNTHDLSTGQKKRLAMIMAMLEDKPVYVLDEWAADQDPQFRRYFYETLLPAFKAQGKTVIAITHDDRYFHVADRIIKMEYGQIAES